MAEANAQGSTKDPPTETQKTQTKTKPDPKTVDKKKIKQSQDQKIDNLTKSMTEMQTSLSQLVDDYYGALNEQSGMCYRRSGNSGSARAYPEECMGNDDQCRDWRQNYDDYDDDTWYEEDGTDYGNHYDDDFDWDEQYQDDNLMMCKKFRQTE